jgi:hypothetical protein
MQDATTHLMLVSPYPSWVPRSTGTHGSAGDRRNLRAGEEILWDSTSTPHSSLSRTQRARARAGSRSRRRRALTMVNMAGLLTQ